MNKISNIANRIQNADNKKKYILGDNQVISNICFINSIHLPEITQLMSKGIQIAKDGLVLQENLQTKLVYEALIFTINEHLFLVCFSH